MRIQFVKITEHISNAPIMLVYSYIPPLLVTHAILTNERIQHLFFLVTYSINMFAVDGRRRITFFHIKWSE